MTELPSGTVAFLFTDVEGSTRLWEHDVRAMHRAIARHNALLDEAIAAHGGHHFKTIGDAFQAAFATAPAAIAAAIAAQRALAREPWDQLGVAGPLRVRMATHAGEATPLDGDYLAPCLNRLARLLATGYGGQVLLTRTVQQLARDDLPAEVTLRDLGTHRLRDLLEPERVFQVVAPDLPAEFPPLKSLERHPTNLPVQPTPMIGRAAELAVVTRLLQRPEIRLITLTGVGGTGKTRLGLQAASDVMDAFDGGVFFVDLAPLGAPGLVVDSLATALGVRQTTDDRALLTTVTRFLGDKHLLLVLDNFEHLLGARSVIADLLAACPNLTILVTSRARLGLRAEHEYRVPPFPSPNPRSLPPLGQLAEYDAVQLFVQRATAARSDFALTDRNAGVVAEICAWLEGLPLAIELAAARVRILPPETMKNRLRTRLKALTGGAHDLPERQRTIRATIAWSYELLATGDQALFRRLAIFAGGFTLEAADAVAQGIGDDGDVLDGVGTLVDQSLLREASGDDGESRFMMLETLREFGREELRAHGEEDDARRRHAAHYATLTTDLDTHLTGDAQQHWLDMLETEHDNLRAAFDYALSHDDAPLARRMGAMIWRFWSLRGHVAEGRSWLARALAAGEDGDAGSRARVHYAAGMLAEDQSDLAEAERHYLAAVALAEGAGDEELIGRALDGLGNTAHDRGHYARAEELHAQALDHFRAAANPRGLASALANLGATAFYRGDFAKADARWREALATMRAVGDAHSISILLSNLGSAAMEQGDLARGGALHAEAIAIQRSLGDKRSLAFSLINLGKILYIRADLAGALTRYDEAIALTEEIGDVRTAGVARVQAGCAHHALGERDRAARNLTVGLTNLQTSDDAYQLANSFEEIACLVAARDAVAATRLIAAAAHERQTIGATDRGLTEAQTQQAIAAARAALGEPGFARAWSEGEAWTLTETMAEAMRISAGLADAPPTTAPAPAARTAPA